MRETIMVSGGFDPLHIGHVQMIQEAAKLGWVIVAVNSDAWLMRKKGYVFMPFRERCEILRAIRGVEMVTGFIDDDDTAINAIKMFKPKYFANGGDRTRANVPEQDICDELGVHMLWEVGGADKPQSSSWLVKRAMDQLRADAE